MRAAVFLSHNSTVTRLLTVKRASGGIQPRGLEGKNSYIPIHTYSHVPVLRTKSSLHSLTLEAHRSHFV